ncbi:hypothetical protein, partial [Phascolarctobacterium faecium]|uniref:hypothetical protein n=1 Tax=Phascolarctobacterium faecium TaxID=33025 RepID=UPI003078BD82
LLFSFQGSACRRISATCIVYYIFSMLSTTFFIFLTVFFSYQLPAIASGDFHYLTRFYEKFQVLFSIFLFFSGSINCR